MIFLLIHPFPIAHAQLTIHSELYMRRTRLLALFLDVLVCAGIADGVGLAVTGLVWRLWPAGRPAIPWLWAALAGGAILAFLLRDARGGRARRWLALEVRTVDGEGGPPGAWRSIGRNAVLLVPGWNLWDAWPALRDGEAPRRCDRVLRLRIFRIT
jgi:hypothetical protein